MRFWRGFLNLLKRMDLSNVRRGFSFSSGVHVNEDSAMKVSALNRGVTYISTQVAKLPWTVKSSDNKVLSTGVSNLLNLAPNPEMNAMMFRLWAIQTALLEGNAYAEIQLDLAGRPIALWPIASCLVDGVRDKEGTFYYRVRGSGKNGEDVYLLPNRIFHVRNFHTKDGIFGQGIVAYAINVLGIALGSDRMAGNLFSNGGIPSGIIKLKGSLRDDKAAKRLKENWTMAHGKENSYGVAVLEDGAEFQSINFAPDILQLLDSRKFTVLEVARFLGVPPTKLFDTTAATYSNTENANLEVATDTLHAWVRMFEMEADIKLLNYQYGGRKSEIDLYDIFRGDMETRAGYYQKMMQSGAITPNEIRMKEGSAPYSGGDRFYIASNNFTPSDRMDELIDAKIESMEAKAEASGVSSEDDTGEEDSKEVKKALIDFLKK